MNAQELESNKAPHRISTDTCEGQVSVASRLMIMSVCVPTDTPDTYWNKLLLYRTHVTRISNA